MSTSSFSGCVGVFGYVTNSFLFLLLGIQIGESSLLKAVAGIGLALLGVVVGRALMISLFAVPTL